MGRTARGIAAAAVVVAVVVLVATAMASTAGAGSKAPRAPRLAGISASVSNKRVAISDNIDPETLETSYQVAVLYRPSNCCTPESKECCAPEVEQISTGTLPASSTFHDIHANAKLREGSFSVRVRVEAQNSAGDSEKTRGVHVPR
jgi:hypothetical protein